MLRDVARPLPFAPVLPLLLAALAWAAQGLAAQSPPPPDSAAERRTFDERQALYRLEQVVVSATGFEQPSIHAPASISIRTREALLGRQAQSVAEALRGIPGVDIDGTDARSNKTGNRTVSLRGLPSDYTLILIDGRRQNVPGTVAPNAFDDSGVVFFPPVAAIERIEVVRGPMSTLYGADALGGVVNIITRPGEPAWTGEVVVDAAFQSDRAFGGNRTVEVYAGGPLGTDRLSVQLHGRVFEREASRIGFPGQDPSLDRRRTMGQVPVHATVYTSGGRVTFAPHPGHRLQAGFDGTRQRYDNRRGELGRISLVAEPGGPGYPDGLSGYAPELGFDREQMYLGHRAAVGPGVLETGLHRNRTGTRGRTIPASAVSEDSPRRGAPRTLESETVVADSRFLLPAGRHTLTLGAQYVDARLTDGIPDRTFHTTQLGLFVENEWRVSPPLALTAGARFDDNSGFGGHFSPRLYAVYRPARSWAVKGGFGQGYRAPFLEQMEAGIIGFGDQGTVPLFGNPDLRPEVSTNVEASVQYDGGGRFAGFVTAFHTGLTDKIERPVGATGGLTQNVGRARLRGFESSARIRLSPAWTASGDYTFTHSEVTTSEAAGLSVGDPLFGVPAHMLNARLVWAPIDALSVELGGEHRSARHRPDHFHEPHLGGGAQGASEALGDFRGYALFDLGAAYRLSERVHLRARIENLLDRDFVDYRPYPLRDDPSVIAYSNVYNRILEPRRLWISVRAGF